MLWKVRDCVQETDLGPVERLMVELMEIVRVTSREKQKDVFTVVFPVVRVTISW